MIRAHRPALPASVWHGLAVALPVSLLLWAALLALLWALFR